MDEAPLTYVDTPEGLRAVAARLGACRELAVDLENHSYRSFQVPRVRVGLSHTSLAVDVRTVNVSNLSALLLKCT